MKSRDILTTFFFIYCIMSILPIYHVATHGSHKEDFIKNHQEHAVELLPFRGDFIAFYNGFLLSRTDHTNLYNLDSQRESRLALIPEGLKDKEALLPFAYPPLVPTLFSSLSHLHPLSAYFSWITLGVLATFISLLCISKRQSAHVLIGKRELPILLPSIFLLGFPPFLLNTITSGQISWLGIVILSAIYISISSGKYFLAGIFLCLGYYKPPIFLLLAIVSFVLGNNKYRLGIISGAICLILSHLLLFDTELLYQYFKIATSYTYGENISPESLSPTSLPPDQGRGTFALFFNVLGLQSNIVITRTVYACLFLSSILALIYASKKHCINLERLFPIVAYASVILSIQCIVYDLSLLLVPLLILLHKRTLEAHEAIILYGILCFPITQVAPTSLVPIVTSGFLTCILFLSLKSLLKGKTKMLT